jgi:hypothetical protein
MRAAIPTLLPALCSCPLPSSARRPSLLHLPLPPCGRLGSTCLRVACSSLDSCGMVVSSQILCSVTVLATETRVIVATLAACFASLWPATLACARVHQCVCVSARCPFVTYKRRHHL